MKKIKKSKESSIIFLKSWMLSQVKFNDLQGISR